MKPKMLIIGTEHPRVRSLKWEEITGDIIGEITDHQIILVDLESCSHDKLHVNFQSGIRDRVIELLQYNHKVIYLWPIKNTHNNFVNLLPLDLRLINKTGTSLHFTEGDPIIDIYKNYINEHKSLIQFEPGASMSQITKLITNNVDEIVSLKKGSFYVLHQPDKHLYDKAIDALVKHFDPVLIEEDWEKPDWVDSYESEQLKTKEIQKDIDGLQIEINVLELEKDNRKAEKQKITKWSDLLYTQGNTLEIRLKEAFDLLGVDKVEHEPNKSHGPDLVIEHSDLAFTVEVEGTKGPIKIDKARELLHWIGDAPPHHKGVLIGNPFREMDPDDRPPENNQLIGKEALELVEKRDLVFITSQNIFDLVCQELNGYGVDIAKVLEVLYSSNGEIILEAIASKKQDPESSSG